MKGKMENTHYHWGQSRAANVSEESWVVSWEFRRVVLLLGNTSHFQCYYNQCFKNLIGWSASLTGPTVGRSLFQFDSVNWTELGLNRVGLLEQAVQPVNRTNRPVRKEQTGSIDFIFYFLKTTSKWCRFRVLSLQPPKFKPSFLPLQ